LDNSRELWITSTDWRASPTSADLGFQHPKYSGSKIDVLQGVLARRFLRFTIEICEISWKTTLQRELPFMPWSCAAAFGQKRSPMAVAQLDRSSYIKVEFALRGLGEFYNDHFRTAK
jgi:hypothetical protein